MNIQSHKNSTEISVCANIFYYYLHQVNGMNGEDTVFVQRMSVCESVRSGPVNQTSLKRLKQRTSNLTCMFPGTVRT